MRSRSCGFRKLFDFSPKPGSSIRSLDTLEHSWEALKTCCVKESHGMGFCSMIEQHIMAAGLLVASFIAQKHENYNDMREI